MSTLSTTWADIKIKTTNGNLTKYYLTREVDYIILIGNSTNQYYTKIIDTDLTDFEDNHKSSAIEIRSFGEALAQII